MFHLQEAIFEQTIAGTANPDSISILYAEVTADVNAFLLTIPGIDVVDIDRSLCSIGKDGSYITLRVAVVYKVYQ